MQNKILKKSNQQLIQNIAIVNKDMYVLYFTILKSALLSMEEENRWKFNYAPRAG